MDLSVATEALGNDGESARDGWMLQKEEKIKSVYRRVCPTPQPPGSVTFKTMGLLTVPCRDAGATFPRLISTFCQQSSVSASVVVDSSTRGEPEKEDRPAGAEFSLSSLTLIILTR